MNELCNDLFPAHADVLAHLDEGFAASPGLPAELHISTQDQLSTWYAPFDHINPNAKVVLVGITPGRSQSVEAITVARRELHAGSDARRASSAAKHAASFAGAMRANLVAMLDHIGLNHTLGLSSCQVLFGARSDLVHYTSALRYPVFIDGKDYAGTPSILQTPYLKAMADRWLAAEVAALPEAYWIPLGKEPKAVLEAFAKEGRLDRSRILDGMPHPSGANAERIAYFLGRKSRDKLSAKTAPDAIDRGREELRGRLGWVGNAASVVPASPVALQAPGPDITPAKDRDVDGHKTQKPANPARQISATSRQAETIVASTFERIRAPTSKIAGFQTTKGRHLALDLTVQGIQVWTEAVPGGERVGLPTRRYEASRTRNSNLQGQAPRLATGREALLWRLETTDQLKELLAWYAAA